MRSGRIRGICLPCKKPEEAERSSIPAARSWRRITTCGRMRGCRRIGPAAGRPGRLPAPRAVRRPVHRTQRGADGVPAVRRELPRRRSGAPAAGGRDGVGGADRAPVAGGAGPEVAGIVAHADLRLGGALEEVLDAHEAAGAGRFCGVRHGLARGDHRPGTEHAPGPAPAGLAQDESSGPASGCSAAADCPTRAGTTTTRWRSSSPSPAPCPTR